ncbi:deoxyhypusine synthase family protein [Candidatus Bathyarchaeota archaeon]|nr:deoxyhypusine synthase family protein [Candidatus Bathyarchaeota archaeon]
MKRVEQMRLRPKMTAAEITDAMAKAGVLQGGRVGRAANIIAEMFSDPDYTVFITLSGPLCHGGLRNIFSDLIRDEYVNAVVTNGANIVGDLIESMGDKHYIGQVNVDDEQLYNKGINRAYDIYFKNETFLNLEAFFNKILDEIPEDNRVNVPIHVLLHEIGLRIEDPQSILHVAAEKKVPIFSPGFVDCMLGIPMWMYSKQKPLSINPLKDFDLFSDLVYDSKKSGAIILGGGTPKHHTQYMHTLKEGLDAAVQISSAQTDDGSLSGAPLKESVSWGKLKGKKMNMTASIFGEVTSLFPLIIASSLEKISK